MAVERVPGKGRCIVSTQDLRPGDLLIASEPMAYVTCPGGISPEPDMLADAVRRTPLSAGARQQLLDLFAGEAQPPEQDEEGGTAHGIAGGGGTGNNSSSTGGGGSNGAPRPLTEEDLDDDRLYGIIGCNSFGEEFHDIPTTRLQLQHARRQRQLLGRLGPGCDTTVAAEPRSAVADLAAGSGSGEGEGPGNEEVEAEDLGRGHLGLWPSFSMLNHSCLPNAINYVVGDRMLVFAARHVPKGHEVCINYLGRSSLRPVEERQAALSAAYLFACDCTRCRTELLLAAGGPAAQRAAEQIEELVARCDRRSEELNDLAGADAGAGAGAAAAELHRILEDVRQDVRQLDGVIAAAVQSLPPMPQASLPQGTGGPCRPAPPAAPGGSSASQHGQGQGAGGNAALWLAASAFDLLGQLTMVSELAGNVDRTALPALERQLSVCAAVAPHSDLHMYLSVKWLSLVQRAKGPGSDEAAAAGAAVRELLRGRYGGTAGGLSEEALDELMAGAACGLSYIAV